jgi:microcompartment protein CcmK/EutM
VELAKVVGTVVATAKDEKLAGSKLLIANIIKPDGKATANYVVAVDTVGAGVGEVVIIVRGSSARQAKNMGAIPTDTSIIGIVDTLEYNGKLTFEKSKKQAG